VATWQINEVIF